MKKLIILFSILSIIPNKNIIGFCDIKGNVVNPGVYEVLENQTIQDVINKAGGLKKNSYTDNINLSKLVKDEMVIYINTKEEIEKVKKLNNCNCTPIYKYIECEKVTTTNLHSTTIPITTTKETTTKETTTKETTKRTTTTTKYITPSISSSTTTKYITTSPNKTTQTTTTVKENAKININTCSIEDLIILKGLGETKAKNIIEYRNSFGLFNSIEEILKVNGIGNKTFENIKDYIEV